MGFVTVKQAPDPSQFEKNEPTSNSQTSMSATIELSKLDYKLDGKTAKQLVRHMEKTLGIRRNQDLSEASSARTLKRPSRSLFLTRQELQVGKPIARGGFGVVHHVESSQLHPAQQYVIKTVYPCKSSRSVLQAISQLYKEEYFLSQLKHKHIIRLEGCSHDGFHSIYHEKQMDAFFLVLPYLPETLTERIAKWKKQKQDSPKRSPLRLTLKRRSEFELYREMYAEQLQVAIDIASAMEYLHENRIVFRDLKPDNIGFDQTGCVKLYDFGLAVQLAPDSDLDDVCDHLVGRVGTHRYMAAEVLCGQKYNVKADVFSFTLLLWQILTLEKPFGTMCEGTVYGDRPKVPKEWPTDLKRILERGWSTDLSERPHMKEMVYALEDLKRRIYE
ncbi:hypothetical protein FisN_27Hh069 [Fistulifera solaris]|uniref:Protein kinase domain-containing protein n=1 Tax=Fistulifera solaris TaxID=1519565 RepID=A0A1Z5KPP2_FISSO|nr:hypothetical protein FisN_27Hh069 [Fistulifera solaris]|eukprot:GAX28280.1 hypothetical protein FisN_27Hh069 [Fistulifera solaris]